MPPGLILPAIALAYAFLGAMGLLLAIPPGFASPMFPASGFAMAVALLAGRKALPGVFIGSLLLNLWAGHFLIDPSWKGGLVALGIAAGSTLQALFAAHLVRGFVGHGWRSLEAGTDVFWTLILAGPVACLVSASLGNLTLFLAGLVSVESVPFSWWSWWIGDVLGVLTFLPITLSLILFRDPLWRARLAYSVLPILVLILAVTLIFIRVAASERGDIQRHLGNHGEEVAKVLGERFIAHTEALASLARLVEVTPGMTYDQFEYFTRITRIENPDIFALSFNPFVLREDRVAIEKQLALRNGIDSFQIMERTPEGKLIPAGDRPLYVPVGYIAPLAGNIAARGFDIASNPIRLDAIQRARASGHLAMTATIRLVQDKADHVGALLLHPAYGRLVAPAADGASDPVRRLTGFAVAVVKLDEMVEISLGRLLDPRLAVSIRDVDGAEIFARAANSPIEAGFVWQKTISVGDREWLVELQPSEAFMHEERTWVAWAVGVVGMLFAALAQMLLLMITGESFHAQRKVVQQSGELIEKEALLQDRSAQLDALFQLSPDGLVVFGRNGLAVYANPAMMRVSGLAAQDILQKTASQLDASLRQRAGTSSAWPGLDVCFDGPVRLELDTPRKSVLDIRGVRSQAPGVSSLLYVRDITHETEVEGMKSQFLSHAAHELRTPMASIFGYSELLLEGDFDVDTRKEMIKTIHSQMLALIDIINELLDISRIESGRGRDFRIEPVQVDALIAQVLEAAKSGQVNRPFDIRIEAGSPRVQADSAKLRQALVNVVGNAVKYSDPDTPVEIDLLHRGARGQAQLGVRVRDHGIGMTAEQVSHVGERFYRADASGKIPGTGLGMAIVKETIELLGGEMEIASVPGEGTSVTLWLPVAPT